VLDFFDGVSDTMIKMVDFIMKIAPYGVFALIAATISEFGFQIIWTLIWYIFAVVLGLFIHTVVIYSILVKSFGKMSPLNSLKGSEMLRRSVSAQVRVRQPCLLLLNV
jgi:Na+/H+-dicarboxylate symporter